MLAGAIGTLEFLYASTQAGVTQARKHASKQGQVFHYYIYDLCYFFVIIFEKYDNERPDPIAQGKKVNEIYAIC